MTKPIAFNCAEHTAALAEIERLKSELKDCRNELCRQCGNYKGAHYGACNGCRWK